jgi:transcriptional regulator with XRE-family HTH domain
MNTLQEFATLLRERMAAMGATQLALSQGAGLTRRTLALVLSGRHDFKLTTLLALLDKLGLEVMIVPKGAAAGLAPASADTGAPAVKSLIDLGQERLATPRGRR